MCSPCFADTNWLTIMGDRSDPLQDTIEVDPTPVATAGEHRMLQIRVNRALPRVNWDGIAYRSYSATADFDCGNKTASFQQLTYYMEADWAGEPHKTVSYLNNPPRPMRFRGVSPNPVDRIIKAACRTVSGN